MEGIVGMIKMVLSPAGNAEWFPCDARMLPIADYPALFALTGNRFGGNGQVEFALPNMPSQEGAHFVIKVRDAVDAPAFKGMVAQMVLWTGDAVPPGWLPCDGRLVQGSDYPVLQKVAAQGKEGPMAEFHLPNMPAAPGLCYMICVDGIDPTAAGGPAAMSDDDY